MRGWTGRCVLCFICTIAESLAQTDRGVITGTVKDATGAVLPGAIVTAVHHGTDTHYKTTTTASGDFTVPSLPVGTYQLKIESQGFKTYLRDNVALGTGATLRINAELELGMTQQTVLVDAHVQMLRVRAPRLPPKSATN
jgi:Carboxypeptidase regulatory-like domain